MSVSGTNEIAALYPPPPPYIKYFTDENLAKLEAHRKSGDASEVGGGELEFLVPPPVPAEGHYRAFGSVWHVKDELPDLSSMGMTQLYQGSADGTASSYQSKIQELHKLLRSLLLNFLELTGILSINPERFAEKVEHIQTILVNIHHLLNEYRPHQSRESLIMLLEAQLEHKRSEIQHIEQVCNDVRAKLRRLVDGDSPRNEGSSSEPKPEDHVQKETDTLT
ncbi:LAQU0S23e00760g1_1 [Lachancea quebecensis]|uniref:Mediator of RNA polymerase II transcription subunit 7 n=1 Tax=Lachancea quebecensis TaxID=1654605 RepID=A0A0P1KXF7_9SACH|nr:LAQU0S23e00760g1_1 [Lachancea quebecensis]